jgi:hypothetical protein
LGEGIGVEIRPEPTPLEREAILRALAAAGLRDRVDSRSAWWYEGLRDEPGSDAMTPPPALCPDVV